MHPKTSKTLMIISKIIFFSFILHVIITQGWKGDLLDITMFFALFIFTHLGTKNHEYYKIDTASNGLFALSNLAVMLGATYTSPYLGFDKFLHFTAGFILAWLAYIIFKDKIILKDKIFDRTVLFISMVSFAVAIGVFWEIFEFAMDNFPAPYRVISLGYADTMLDIVSDTIGAVVFASIALLVIAYYAKKPIKK